MDGKGSSSRENQVTHMMDRIHPLTHGHTWNQRNGKEKRMFLAFDCLDNSIRDSVLQQQKKKEAKAKRIKEKERKKLCAVCMYKDVYCIRGLFCYLRFQSHAPLASRRNINRASE